MSDEFLGEIISKMERDAKIRKAPFLAAIPALAGAAARGIGAGLGRAATKGGMKAGAKKIGQLVTDPTFGMVMAPATGGLSLIPTMGRGVKTRMAGKKAAKDAANTSAFTIEGSKDLADEAAESAAGYGKKIDDLAAKHPEGGYNSITAEQQRIDRLQGEMDNLPVDDAGAHVDPFARQRIQTEMQTQPTEYSQADVSAAEARTRDAQAMNEDFANRTSSLEEKRDFAQSEQERFAQPAKDRQASADKAQAVHNEELKTQNRELTDQALVGVQAVQAGAAQRAQEDRQRRGEDEERAREAASTGGAKSTTTG